MKNVNENNLTVTDIIKYLGEKLEENYEIKLSGNKLKNVFIEAICRNIVMEEIKDMMLFIADEEKHDEVHGWAVKK